MSTEPSTNFAAIYIVLFVAQWIFNVAIAAWLYLRKADGSNEKAINAVRRMVESFIQEQKERMTKLESDVKHLPTDEEISQIREDVATTKALQVGMAEALRRVEHQTNLIHEHLLSSRRV